MTEPAIEGTAEDLGGELVPHEPQATAPAHATLFATDDPVEVVERATRVADALKGVLASQGMIARIGGKEHVQVEGWQTLGGMLGVVPVVVWTRRVTDPDGWEAKVEARTLDGRIVGSGEAQCDRGEKKWKTSDEYAIRSMAQTRATSKALAAPLRFIVKLAGYSGTPAEEMPSDSGYGKPPEERGPSVRQQIYGHASGRLKALELLNAIRHVTGAEPLNIGEQDAMTRLDAAVSNVKRQDVSKVLARIDEVAPT